MTLGHRIVLMLRLALFGVAIAMAWMVHSPVTTIAGLAFLLGAALTRNRVSWNLTKLMPWAAFMGSCLAVISLTWGEESVFTFNTFFAAQAWLIALALVPYPRAETVPNPWKMLSMAW